MLLATASHSVLSISIFLISFAGAVHKNCGGSSHRRSRDGRNLRPFHLPSTNVVFARNWKQVWSGFSSCVAFKPTVSLLLLYPSFAVHVYGCSWFSFSFAISVDSSVLRLDFKWQHENPTFHHRPRPPQGIRENRRVGLGWD